MARPLRIGMSDGLDHVTTRGWERRVIVDSDRDREDWLRLIDHVATRCDWRVFAWVLMSLLLRSLGRRAHLVGLAKGTGGHSVSVRNARRSYQRFVEAGIERAPISPLASAIASVFLGTASWVEEIRQQLTERPKDTNVPQRQQLVWRPGEADTIQLVQSHIRHR